MTHDELPSLIERIGASGDLDALGHLFDLAAPGLLRLALRVTGDSAEAEDVLQETFLAVLKGAHSYDPSRPAGAWLGTVLANVASRRRRKRSPLEMPAGMGEGEGELAEPRDEEAWRRTRAEIENLPTHERSAMLLRYEQGLSPKRIAEILSISESTVRSSVARGTQRLRSRLLPAALALPLGRRFSSADALARVREKLMGDGAAVAVGGGIAAAVVAGGIAVGMKQVLVVVAVLFIGAAGTWTVLHESRADRTQIESRTTVPSRELALNPTTTSETTLEGAKPTASPGAPPPAPAPTRVVPRYTGRILDFDGHVVPGAWASVVAAMGLNGEPDLAPFAALEIDADGRFAFEIPKTIGQVTVRCGAPGYVSQWTRDFPVFADRSNDITLLKAVELRVRVRDAATDRPVTSASVRSYRALMHSIHALRAQGFLDEATTDASGRVVLQVSVGVANVLVRAEGFSNVLLPPIDVTAMGADVVASLRRGTRIEGQFVDAAGRGKPGLQVVVNGHPLYERKFTTDADGRFVLENAPSSSDPVEPFLRSHLDLWTQLPGSDDAARFIRVDPPAEGETKSVTLVWPEGRRLHGRVRRADGSPMAGLSIAPLPDDARTRSGAFNWLSSPTTTDPEGRFTFEHVPPGVALVRVARSPEGMRQPLFEKRLEIPVSGDVADVELVVAEAPSDPLRVRVVDPEGRPIAKASVQCARLDEVSWTGTWGTTSPEGEALLEGAKQPGKWLVVHVPSFAPVCVAISPAAIAVGFVEVRLPRGHVRGRVLRLDGSPPPPLGVRISAFVTDGSPSGSRRVTGHDVPSDAEGRFAFDGLGDGAYEVDIPVSSWRCLGGGVRVHAGDDDVRLVAGSEEETRDMQVEAEIIEPTTGPAVAKRTFDVRLVNAGSADVAAPVARLQDVDGIPGLYRTFFPMNAGLYDIVVPGQAGVRESRVRGVRVGPGIERKRHQLILDRGASVTGHVTDGDGKPATGVLVNAAGQTAVVQADGTYTVTGLDAGTVDVRVAGPFAESEPLRVTVRSGEAASADFAVATGGAIGIGFSRGSMPASGVSVTAAPLVGGAPSKIELSPAEFHGQVTLRRMVPGRYRVEISWDGRVIATQEVEVTDRAMARIEAKP